MIPTLLDVCVVCAFVGQSTAILLPRGTPLTAAADDRAILARSDAPYRYRISPERQKVIEPSRPFYYYRPRAIVPGAPETRIERRPPTYLLRRPEPAGRAARMECRLTSKPASDASSVHAYGARRDCD
jgi:hypothetical protein